MISSSSGDQRRRSDVVDRRHRTGPAAPAVARAPGARGGPGRSTRAGTTRSWAIANPTYSATSLDESPGAGDPLDGEGGDREHDEMTRQVQRARAVAPSGNGEQASSLSCRLEPELAHPLGVVHRRARQARSLARDSRGRARGQHRLPAAPATPARRLHWSLGECDVEAGCRVRCPEVEDGMQDRARGRADQPGQIDQAHAGPVLGRRPPLGTADRQCLGGLRHRQQRLSAERDRSSRRRSVTRQSGPVMASVTCDEAAVWVTWEVVRARSRTHGREEPAMRSGETARRSTVRPERRRSSATHRRSSPAIRGG